MSSFPHLSAFMQEVWEAHRAEPTVSLMTTFTQMLKTKRYWPALQWKKFRDDSGLLLLHNTYKRTDVDAFQGLYDECRSVVLDLNAPEGENVVISLANAIPERMAVEEYKNKAETNDLCQVSYEGTVISVYYYKDKWYFSTSSCPSVNMSRYIHPTKRHGTMLDEVLAVAFPSDSDASDEASDVREHFTENLDTGLVYYFILVHHENTHLMDYTAVFGAEYKKLIHILTRDKTTQAEVALPCDAFLAEPLSKIVQYSQVFETPTAAIEWAESDDPTHAFGVIIKRDDGKLWKVAKRSMIDREQEDIGNPNPWMNMLWVYIQNRPHYHVNHYIEKYCPTIEFPTDQYGRTLAPVYMIHTAICTIRDCLYQCYRYTTNYYPEYNRWKMNKVLDEALPKIIRFHLSQLRIIQVSTHRNEYLTAHTVYHYICHHQSMPNLLKLIGFFANNPGDTFNLSPRTTECFRVLHRMLTQE